MPRFPTPTSAASMRGQMRFPHRRRVELGRQDEGAALAVALIFMLVVGILITAALSKSGAVLKSDYLVRQQAQMQYAADAGIERALQVLRDDVSASPAHYCPKTTPAASADVSMTGSADPNSKDPGGLSFNLNLADSNSPHAPLK